MAIRFSTFLLALAAVAGCSCHPLRLLMRGDVTTQLKATNTASPLIAVSLRHHPADGPAVAIIDVDGLLVNKNLRGLGSMGENPVALFREKLEAVACDPQVRAVVLRINSPGGGVTATDVMRRDLARLRQIRQIPVVACLMDVGAGGAYYLATEADVILAHPTTITGGIGVILNVYNLQDTLGQFNIVPVPIKAGEKIDMTTPVRPMSEQEHDLLVQIAEQYHERFKQAVAESRSLPAAAEEDFDGRIFTARQALDRRLIDGVGYLDDAIASAARAAGCPATIRLVMYRRDNDRAYTAYDVTPNVPLQESLLPMSIPGLERSSLPTFLYLWQPDPSFVASAGAR